MKNIGVSFTIDTLLTVFNRESNKKIKKQNLPHCEKRHLLTVLYFELTQYPL